MVETDCEVNDTEKLIGATNATIYSIADANWMNDVLSAAPSKQRIELEFSRGRLARRFSKLSSEGGW